MLSLIVRGIVLALVVLVVVTAVHRSRRHGQAGLMSYQMA
jgi:hypothetical protein